MRRLCLIRLWLTTDLYVASWDLVRARKAFNDVILLQLVLIAPQPIYYVTCQCMKYRSEFQDVWYPTFGDFFAEFLLIWALYLPMVALWYMERRMIRTCVRRAHPYYDFATNQLYVKRTTVVSDAAERQQLVEGDEDRLETNATKGSLLNHSDKD